MPAMPMSSVPAQAGMVGVWTTLKPSTASMVRRVPASPHASVQ